MFDIGFYEVLVFAVVTLIFVGPKELPVLMRTVGRYVGILRRQADEFRGHFDAAMQEAEIDKMQADLESVSKEVDQSFEDASSALDEGVSEISQTEPLGIEAGSGSDKSSNSDRLQALSSNNSDRDTGRDTGKGDA